MSDYFPSTEHLDPTTVITAVQLASLMQVDPSQVRRWCRRGRGPRYRLTPGKHYRCLQSDVSEWLRSLKHPQGDGS